MNSSIATFNSEDFKPFMAAEETQKMWWSLRTQENRSEIEEKLYQTLTANLTVACSIVSVSVELAKGGKA